MKHLLPLSTLLISACFLKNDPPVQSFDYGTMVDPRDGQSYRTLNYQGLTWMVQSLNWHTPGALCDSTKFGFCLYQKKQIINDFLQIQVCPAGWHLPAVVEWAHSFYNEAGDLMDEVRAFNSTDSSWYENDRINNNDKYGFAAKPNFKGACLDDCFAMALTSQECPNRISTLELTSQVNQMNASFYGFIYHKGQKEVSCDAIDRVVYNEDTSSLHVGFTKVFNFAFADTSESAYWQIRCVKNITP